MVKFSYKYEEDESWCEPLPDFSIEMKGDPGLDELKSLFKAFLLTLTYGTETVGELFFTDWDGEHT
jgi:hypothetical protein